MGGIRGLEVIFSSKDCVAPREVRVVLVSLALSIGVTGVIGVFSDWNANCCCANAHSVVDVFEVRGESAANDCCVLRAGGGPVAFNIPLLLCDAGPRLALWSC